MGIKSKNCFDVVIITPKIPSISSKAAQPLTVIVVNIKPTESKKHETAVKLYRQVLSYRNQQILLLLLSEWW